MNQLIGTFTDNLLPIMLIAGAGFLLGKTLSIDMRSVGRVIFYVFSPVLVFNLLLHNQIPLDEMALTVIFSVSMFLIVGGLAYLIARLMRLPRPVLIIVVLTAMFGNTGNFGLSLVAFAFGKEALAFASIYFVMSAIAFNTLGVLIASLGHLSFKDALKGMLRVPTVYAVALAFIINLAGFSLPTPIARTVDLLAGGAIPLMLLLLGLELTRVSWAGNLKVIGVSTVLRLIVAPLVGILTSAPFGFTGATRQANIVETSVPTAVTTIVLATEYQLDSALVTGIVFVTTLLSPLTITPLLVLLGSS